MIGPAGRSGRFGREGPNRSSPPLLDLSRETSRRWRPNDLGGGRQGRSRPRVWRPREIVRSPVERIVRQAGTPRGHDRFPTAVEIARCQYSCDRRGSPTPLAIHRRRRRLAAPRRSNPARLLGSRGWFGDRWLRRPARSARVPLGRPSAPFPRPAGGTFPNRFSTYRPRGPSRDAGNRRPVAEVGGSVSGHAPTGRPTGRPSGRRARPGGRDWKPRRRQLRNDCRLFLDTSRKSLPRRSRRSAPNSAGSWRTRSRAE